MIFQKAITEENPCKICFVCFENICRSPIAEAIFRSHIEEKGLENYFVIDSAGLEIERTGVKAEKKQKDSPSTRN